MISGILCTIGVGIFAMWQYFDAREERAAASMLIDAQRSVIDALVVKLNARKAKQAALLVALTDAQHAAERGDIGDLSEALRSATAIIGGL